MEWIGTKSDLSSPRLWTFGRDIPNLPSRKLIEEMRIFLFFSLGECWGFLRVERQDVFEFDESMWIHGGRGWTTISKVSLKDGMAY